MKDDIAFIDEYLNFWDCFARGQNELAPFLRDNRDIFEAALARLIRRNESIAAPRLVFYAVVQIGGFIMLNSELGQAASSWLGPTFPVFTAPDGSKSYFAGQLYFWWEENAANCSSFLLLDDWLSREFSARVISKYRSACGRT